MPWFIYKLLVNEQALFFWWPTAAVTPRLAPARRGTTCQEKKQGKGMHRATHMNVEKSGVQLEECV